MLQFYCFLCYAKIYVRDTLCNCLYYCCSNVDDIHHKCIHYKCIDLSNVQLYYVSSAVSLYFPYDFCLYPGMTALVSYSLRYIPFVLGLIISVILYSANRWMCVHAFIHLCSYLECDNDHTVYCWLVFSCVITVATCIATCY